MNEAAEMVEWRESIIDDAIIGLKQFQAERVNHRYNQWLYRMGVSMYVRQRSYHNMGTDDTKYTCFVFANLQVLDQYKGQGIMLEIIERWHTMHQEDATYVESVLNPDFERRLIAAGWIPSLQPGTHSYYKTTKR